MSLLTGTALKKNFHEVFKYADDSKLSAHINSCFRGCILLAPALCVKELNPLVRFIGDNILAQFFPQTQVPILIDSSGVTGYVNSWRDSNYIKYIQLDQYPNNPLGLTYGTDTFFYFSLIHLLHKFLFIDYMHQGEEYCSRLLVLF